MRSSWRNEILRSNSPIIIVCEKVNFKRMEPADFGREKCKNRAKFRKVLAGIFKKKFPSTFEYPLHIFLTTVPHSNLKARRKFKKIISLDKFQTVPLVLR